MTFAVIWSLVAVSLVVLTGWGGNISLGQFGIVGVGAMTAGELMLHWNLDLFLGILASRSRSVPSSLRSWAFLRCGSAACIWR